MVLEEQSKAGQGYPSSPVSTFSHQRSYLDYSSGSLDLGEGDYDNFILQAPVDLLWIDLGGLGRCLEGKLCSQTWGQVHLKEACPGPFVSCSLAVGPHRQTSKRRLNINQETLGLCGAPACGGLVCFSALVSSEPESLMNGLHTPALHPATMLSAGVPSKDKWAPLMSLRWWLSDP